MPTKARMGTGKLCSAEQAVAMIRPGSCITVSGVVGWMYPAKLVNALEVRYLTTGEPGGLTLFDPFPTGVPGIEPFAHPGFLKRVVGGWYTPHPRMCEMIDAGEIEAYLFPLGTLSFLCQQMAAGRRGFLTEVGLETYLDPRETGGKLNSKTTEDIVTLAEVGGREYLWYKTFPIDAALIRGTVIDEAGNLSIEDEAVTMNILNQAMAAKGNGGVVIAQAKRLVAEGGIPARLVAVPGALVDAIVIDPDQHLDELNPDLDWLRIVDRLERPPDAVLAAPNKDAWRKWVFERTIDDPEEAAVSGAAHSDRPVTPTLAGGGPVLEVRPITADVAIARRAAMEIAYEDFVNIGAGVASRDLLPVCIEEGIDRDAELSMEGGILGGLNNGIGFRSNVTSTLDTPSIFSLYGAGIASQTFLSMLEFDREGNANLLRYGKTWVGPGGSMDIAHSMQKIVFVATLRAGGLQIAATGGTLKIVQEGRIPRAVERVQGICFNGKKMLREGKDVIYVTERAVFRLVESGLELIEVAPGLDPEHDVIQQMEFRPAVSPELKTMDPRIFTPGRMGLRPR